MIRDGWYFTGDIGFVDERGYLTLLGPGGPRHHRSVASRSIPSSLEAEIFLPPGVRHAAVYGVRDEDGSDHIHAAIECDPAENVDVADIRTRITEALSPIHVPEKIAVFSTRCR
ncbi:hypothetical protein [Streptomyces sp. KL116D]|uniref:hypothetical protein n=1 Tax=Streptomyces sp. KL116D TaxID=3045152 RepID=UPI0035567137